MRRLRSALPFRLGVGFFGQNINLAISPDQQQKSLCLVGRTSRFQTGGSIQFLREVKWRGLALSCPAADGLYAASTPVLLAAALLGLRKKAGLSTFQRQAIGVAALCFFASVGLLALLSIQFDFGNCINPSRGHPYFASGRLLSGALIPFALSYVYGIDWLFRRINPALPLLVLGGLLAFVTMSEIKINRAVFASEHNWFHR
jgi:hypothetical protein